MSIVCAVKIENLTAVRSGWAGAIDGPSHAIGDQHAQLKLELKDVRIESQHGFASWGRLDCTAVDVTPMPAVCKGKPGY